MEIALGLTITLAVINFICLIIILKNIRQKEVGNESLSNVINDNNLKMQSIFNEQFLNINDRLSQSLLKINEDFTKFEVNIVNSNNAVNNRIEKEVQENFLKLNSRLDQKFQLINENVELKINDNFKRTNETFTSIVERLSKIDQAQKNIDSLSTNIIDLQNILDDKTVRGSFGEVQLNNILGAVFGQNNKKVYELQYKMPNDRRVDVILHAPKPLGDIGIDSKFPLENYRMLANNPQDVEYLRKFKLDIKKHIDDIANKYIIATYTSQAIMFIPAEAVYSFIHAHCPDLIEYSNKRKVWLTSPTTLMSTLTTMQVILKNMERDQYAQVIQVELSKLGAEFKRFEERFSKLTRSITTLNNSVEEISITSKKITKRFNEISNVDNLEKLE